MILSSGSACDRAPLVAAFRQDHRPGDGITGRSKPNRILGGYYVRKARRMPLLSSSAAVPALDRWSIKFYADIMEM